MSHIAKVEGLTEAELRTRLQAVMKEARDLIMRGELLLAEAHDIQADLDRDRRRLQRIVGYKQAS